MRKRIFLQFGLITLLLVALITPAIVYLVYLYNRPQPQIVVALTSRDRNLVYVALWTLGRDGISVSDKIDIDGPFAQAQPALTELVDEVSSLDEKRLDSLDRVFAARLFIHSPSGPDTYWE